MCLNQNAVRGRSLVRYALVTLAVEAFPWQYTTLHGTYTIYKGKCNTVALNSATLQLQLC